MLIQVLGGLPNMKKMILGLDFIVHNNRSVTIIKDYLLISTNSQKLPIIDELTSELRTKRGDAHQHQH